MIIDCVEDLSCVIAKSRQRSHTRRHYSPCYNLINTLAGEGERGARTPDDDEGGGGGGREREREREWATRRERN